MEIKGKVLTLFPVKEGVGKTSGTPWKSREFVIETQDQYPKRICLQVMNANMDRFPMEEGMEVSVKFDISARERDGRYFNTLTAWDITVLNSRPSNYKPQNKMFHFYKTFYSKTTHVNTIQNVILNPI